MQKIFVKENASVSYPIDVFRLFLDKDNEKRYICFSENSLSADGCRFDICEENKASLFDFYSLMNIFPIIKKYIVGDIKYDVVRFCMKNRFKLEEVQHLEDWRQN